MQPRVDRHRLTFVLLAWLGRATVCFAQDVARMDQVVQSYVSNGTFAGSVLVARGSDVIVSKGYGLANVEWNVPSSPSARFKVASITKQFTAAAILLLEERGRLKIDDLLKTHLPEALATWDRITLFHLLTHTAGFPGLQSPPTGRQAPVESADGTVAGFVTALMQRPLESQPGERFNYTNSGYFVLGHLIQKLTGKSYETFLRENIFTPLGMKDSALDSPSVIARRAGSYTVTPNGLVNASYASDRIVPNTAAGLYSTTEDLMRWQNGLYGGKVISNVHVVPVLWGSNVPSQVASNIANFYTAVTDSGLFLESELQRLSARHGLGGIRGKGLLLALDLKRPIGAAIVALGLQDGVLLNAPQSDTLRFMPALNVTRDEIVQMIAMLDTILRKLGVVRCVG